ncbi:MAG: hypothetical protein U0R44_06110 [Candidatus Micrarchaeia archaeon]
MKNKIASVLFILLAIIVMGGAWYLVYSYASGLIGAVVEFITSNDYTKLQQCGVTPPTEFNRIKADFAGVILPAMYVGIPVMLILVSYLMFMAGIFYHKAKLEDDAKKREVLEREMVHKIVNKMQNKPSSGMPPRRMPEPEETEEEATEEQPVEEPAEEEQEESEPPPKQMVKKKK